MNIGADQVFSKVVPIAKDRSHRYGPGEMEGLGGELGNSLIQRSKLPPAACRYEGRIVVARFCGDAGGRPARSEE
jgi:hypothetical protein